MENYIIKNKACAEVDFCGEKIEVYSNQLEAKPVKFKVEKTQNCDFVFVGHHLKYTVKIINECTTDLLYVLFKDFLDECTTYVAGSFRYNGDPWTPELDGNELKFWIDTIKEKETATITFDVKVDEDCCDPKEEPKEPEKELEKSAAPTIKTIEKDDSSVSGTGVKGATVYVKFPNDEVVTGTVNSSNNWTVQTPSKVKLKKGEIVSAYQIEPGKAASATITKTVIDD